MSVTALADHCALCFAVLHRDLGSEKHGRSRGRPVPSDVSVPLFVTWNIHRGGDRYDLRGCIGTFSAQSLAEGLTKYARIAAFRDTRFQPIALSELPRLQCCVSLLTDFETASSPEDWDIGTHGITIEFKAGGRRYSATYLPEVAPAQGWNKQQTLASLVKKAGYRGSLTTVLAAIQVTRYQSSKASLKYDDYISTWSSTTSSS